MHRARVPPQLRHALQLAPAGRQTPQRRAVRAPCSKSVHRRCKSVHLAAFQVLRAPRLRAPAGLLLTPSLLRRGRLHSTASWPFAAQRLTLLPRVEERTSPDYKYP